MVAKRNNGASGKSGATKGRALALAQGREIAPVVQADGATVERDGPATLVRGRAYTAGDLVVPASAIFEVQGLKPGRHGPWLGEADKVAWRDPATGYDCIMMRAGGGNLCGYVGLPRSHPLYGWHHEAIPPEVGIDVHGGITYSRVCQQGPARTHYIRDEARSVCHVLVEPTSEKATRRINDLRPQDEHAWWLGFECDGIYDEVPGNPQHAENAMNRGIAQVYRDHEYVLRETLEFAAQLHAIEDGTPVPPRMGPDPASMDLGFKVRS